MVSVIYNSFNRKEQLQKGITSLLSQPTTPDEIIVVDDGSSDGTDKVIESFGFPIKHIYIPYASEKKSGNISCHGKNIGVREATGDILVFSDPEIVHVEDTLGILLDAMAEEPLCIPIATQIWTMGEKIYKKLSQDHFDRPKTIIGHNYAQMTDADNPNNMKAPDADWAISGANNCFAGCFFACRKEDMMHLRGFDEGLTGYGWEDWDMFHRLERYGRPLKYINTPIIHLWHPKVYDFNIYEAGEANGKKSEANVRAGRLVANLDNESWGKL